MLDTNLWSRIGEEGTATTFVAALRDMGYAFVLPPSMLLEVMQTPNADTRRQIVAAMSSAQGLRLRTEVDLCTNEFRTALQRKRPAWLRSIPDAAAVSGWRTHWTKQVWRDARNDSEKFHQDVVRRPSLAAVDDWYETQLKNKQRMREDGFSSDFIDLELRCTPDEANTVMPGWDGSSTAGWRVLIGEYYWYVLSQRHSSNETQRQWFAAYLDIDRIVSDADEFAQFFLAELEPHDIRREWLRYAVGHTQLERKVKKSNALDAQHSMYLVDADLFLSGDQAFVAVLRDVRRQAPFRIADPRRVELTNSWTDGIIAALASVA
ncbi:hypothetical protein [Mycobacterium asiaticum]|nr:hypothetical protein [Mycobacterium asiaticum]